MINLRSRAVVPARLQGLVSVGVNFVVVEPSYPFTDQVLISRPNHHLSDFRRDPAQSLILLCL